MDENKNELSFFQMPLHYPRYTKKDYENMPEWKLDRILSEYGLTAMGDLDYKREFAIGAFLWPSENVVVPHHHYKNSTTAAAVATLSTGFEISCCFGAAHPLKKKLLAFLSYE